ncbi:hypothetical protein JJB07_09135 [Tumebacillus sp. ITR2]|uniref:5-bromo-4-chloroindolyl phosphate hydrolysis protein n=1 Tax=Tumebacillus amylolyticus TaxID=2801339 RepID=A0ABS1J973_9BACL|nr:hypothetical protein [Tumebacillus amylolyticus]MBL0386816.1 hypothetical protein [Tumebacillus amylolyticus]
MFKNRIFVGGAVGYLFALVTSPLLPEILSLLFPIAGIAIGTLLQKQTKKPDIQTVEPVQAPTETSIPTPQPQIPESEFTPVLEYLAVLEDMVMSEGQKNNLDDEIVDRCLIVFARIQRLVPFLEELNNGDINHTVRRLVLKDLNGFITPFLRLSGENKTKNRRTLLNGIKDINMKITSIMETIEYKDLIELQTKADLIHRRYNESEGY